MNKTVTVTFDGTVLHPDSPLNLEPNKRYRIQIISEEQLPNTSKENAWDILESLTATIEGSSIIH